MTLAARVQAQAKINLYLTILPGVDREGYHHLFTIFQRIDLADEVVLRLGGTERSLDAEGPSMPASGLGPVEKNLAFRAAETYLRENGRGLPSGFEIHLTKRIPVGGGLGGGSADAAGVLRALQRLSATPLPAEALRSLAGQLGADVPFLASDSTCAMGSGRGDQLMPLPMTPDPADVLLVIPSFAIGTAEAYRWLDEARGPKFMPARGASGPQELVSGWGGFDLGNDFESVVEARFPKIREYREALKSNGATLARMSGSGSTVFGIFESGAPAPENLGVEARVVPTRTSARVVQVEVLQ